LLGAPPSIGWWQAGAAPLQRGGAAATRALADLDQPFAAVWADEPAIGIGGTLALGGSRPSAEALPALAWVPALPVERLGDPGFRREYGVRAAYCTGAMANGIGSPDLVIAMARAGMMGFFGAAALTTDRSAAAIDRVDAEIGGLPAGWNLIHSPAEPRQEQETVDLYLRRGIRTVDAAAYLALTPMVVQYRYSGLHTAPDGAIRAPNRLLAKVSREEVAEKFLRPAPAAMVARLVEEGRLNAEEARLAARVPMADDLTCEADSGGHTDRRPLTALIPLIAGLRDRIAAELGYPVRPRIGAAGGIGTPHAVAAAFALGAAYVMTGTINQACRESGTSDRVRAMLAEAGMADVAMAPASDMFEAGVEVQVLRRGTLFAQRGRQLYDLYRAHAGLDEVPPDVLARLEDKVFGRPIAAVWRECEAYFAARDPAQLERAAREPKHRMALVFRWYLGQTSRWAIGGADDRTADYQIWCGPAIGAFNAWTRGTFLGDPLTRSAPIVAVNLMTGAAALTRARLLRDQGVEPPPEAFIAAPRAVRSDA
jgi:PfaD family protein